MNRPIDRPNAAIHALKSENIVAAGELRRFAREVYEAEDRLAAAQSRRDDAVLRLAALGTPHAAIAADGNLTRSRVSQIVRAAEEATREDA